MSLVAVLLLFTLTLIAPVTSVSAQDATPAAQAATPVAIPGSDCTIAPRTVAAIAEIVTEADVANSTPVPEAAPYVKPDGTPADAETVAGVTATVQQLVACINAGDFLRFLSLFSNDALRRYAADLDLPLEPDNDLLTPDPSINDQLALAGIADVLELADGRVSVLVTLSNQTDGDGGNESAEVLQLILTRENDRWLIDELIPIAPAEEEPAASTWIPVSGTGYEGVIVDALSAPEFAQWFSAPEATAGWEPTPDDIAKLEAALPAFLATAPQATDAMRQGLADYKRQYAGIVDSDNRQFIIVNAFCTDAGIDWYSQPVLILDGGDCFFSLVYEPATGTFSGLMVNGEA